MARTIKNYFATEARDLGKDKRVFRDAAFPVHRVMR
jgi:hypothetical protein